MFKEPCFSSFPRPNSIPSHLHRHAHFHLRTHNTRIHCHVPCAPTHHPHMHLTPVLHTPHPTPTCTLPHPLRYLHRHITCPSTYMHLLIHIHSTSHTYLHAPHVCICMYLKHIPMCTHSHSQMHLIHILACTSHIHTSKKSRQIFTLNKRQTSLCEWLS